MIKMLLKKNAFLIIPLAHMLISLFFDKKYLQGRFFEKGYGGYLWALRSIVQKNILRLGPPMPWPTGLTCHVSNPSNITFHPDDLNNFQSPGTYFQNFKGHIYLGFGSYISPNVGIITAGHKLDNLNEHEEGMDVVIGKECWIGMNAVIMPGVTLGDRTIVASCSVVNKSFPQGGIIIGGAPAKVIKKI
ncbi:MAG TPA: acyltransferase [Bacteroidetes bacterium]|nr:acyltransferase [Bacteroidota bacterium]